MWLLVLPLLFLGSLIHPVQMSPWQMFQNMCHNTMLVQGPQCQGNPNQQQQQQQSVPGAIPSISNQPPQQSFQQQPQTFNTQQQPQSFTQQQSQVPVQQERPPFAGAPSP